MRLFGSLLILLALALAPLSAQSVVLKGVGRGGEIKKITVGQVDYVAGSELFSALQCRAKWNGKEQKLEATLFSHHLVFQPNNVFCSVDAHLYNLVHEPVFRDGDLYLPVNQTVYLLSDVLERVLIYDARRGTISAIGKEFNVVGATLQEKVNGDLLEIMLTRKLDYEVFVSEGNWINITIPDGLVDAGRFDLDRRSDKVIAVRAFQFAGSAQISIQMRINVGSFHTNYAPDPHRIQISLESTNFVVQSTDSAQAPRHDNINPIDVIVIDPGHGGEHDGAIGRNGLREKEVTLDIALRTEELLAANQRFKVVMTRRDDVTVGLEERAKIANDAHGDLYVSIHANSSDIKGAGGSETYFLAAAKSDEARITEMLENSDFEVEIPQSPRKGKDELDFILMDVFQTEYLSQSQQLAESIQEFLRTSLSIKSRGVNQAGFRVLNKVKMPSVLVEVAFISNKIEERLLGQESFRQTAAESIYEGVMKFIDRYEKEAKASAGSQ